MAGRPSTRERRSRVGLTRGQALVDDKLLAAPETGKAAALADHDLDRKIADQIRMIKSALADRYRALETIKKCEKSAVISAWHLGHFLIEKKDRLEHGRWLPWLESTGISSSSAADYMRVGREISSAGYLKSSIRATLRALPSPSATPKPKPVIEPAEPAPAEPDNAAVIEDLETELYDAQERIGIMEEAADPKSRKAIDKLNNQAELIKTLKASVGEWQSKHADARRENGALKRKIKELETELGGRRPRHAA